MKPIYLIVAVAVVLLIAGYSLTRPEKTPEPVNNSPFSSNCVFYKKVMGGDFVISEPKAGTFRYEIYATSDGIEVWKCNKF